MVSFGSDSSAYAILTNRLSQCVANGNWRYETNGVVGYSFVHEGNVCYINDVENGIQKDGMYFSWQTTSEEAAVGVMYGTLLTPLPGSSKYFGGMDDFIFRGRILDFALFVDKQRRRSQEGTLDVE